MVIGGLKPDTTYSITVAAYTTKGDGARSKPKLVVTKGAGQSSVGAFCCRELQFVDEHESTWIMNAALLFEASFHICRRRILYRGDGMNYFEISTFRIDYDGSGIPVGSFV